MALCNRVVKSGVNSAIFFAKSRAINASSFSGGSINTSSSSSSFCNRFDYRHIWQLVEPNKKRAFLVDTLALMRGLESQDVPSKQAEAITAATTQVLNDNLENVSHYSVSKAELQKSEMIQESNLSKFKSEVQSSQEHRFSMLQRDIEKIRSEQGCETAKLRAEIEKMRKELKYEIDNSAAASRGLLEAAKYDMLKSCTATLVSICAVGIAAVRILM